MSNGNAGKRRDGRASENTAGSSALALKWMLACDLREKGEDDDDLEISLVVIVVEESRINQVAFTREKKEKGPSTRCKRAWRMQTAPSGQSLFILFRLGFALCMYTRRERERKK